MNLYKKKYLYANGSSVTAGGGFEAYEHRQDIRPLYESKGIYLPPTQIECSYPFFIAKYLNLEVINDAKSGSGIDRLIRTTFDWIINNEEKVEQTIFILEPQFGIRLDWFVFDWGDYGVLNAHKDGSGNYPFTLVKDWYTDEIDKQQKWNAKYGSAIDEYFSNFFDPEEQYNSELKRLVMFVEFLNSRKIDYLISLPSYIPINFKEIFEKTIPRSNNLYYKFEEFLWPEAENACIWEYARYTEMLICDDIDNDDNHIGYEGNQLIGRMIADYIKLNNTITYYAHSSISNLTNGVYTKNSSISFKRTLNIDEADFVYLNDFNIFHFDNICKAPSESRTADINDYIEQVNSRFPWIKEIDVKNKRFLIILFHERIYTEYFVKFVEFLHKEYGIKRSQIWYLDLNLHQYPLTNHIPLELKIRTFAALSKFKLYNDDHYRNKKIMSLNNKVSLPRLLTFDRILYEYEDHVTLKQENIISMREDGGVHEPMNEPIIIPRLKNKASRYKELELPWFIDDWTRELQGANTDGILHQLIEYNKQCIVSIVCETERSIFLPFDPERDYVSIYDIQFSEKCLFPILGGSFMFVITDGIFYRNFEDIGFDFSYLKKLFNIDYLTNTLEENIDEVSKIAKFVANKSIEELNAFRKKHYHYIQHNRNLLLDIMLGDYNDNEIKFWERLSGKKLR